MAVCLLSYDVSDLCLGKPPLKPISAASATVIDALSALKSSSDNHVCVWSCDHSSGNSNCLCIGKVCMVDVICYLCKEENLSSPATALKAPVTAILPKVPNLVRHIDPPASVLEAIELILEGAQSLVVPIESNYSCRRKPQKETSHNCREFCLLTQEDVIRFLLGSIGLFSPLAALSIDALGLISDDYVSIPYHSPASAALPAISRQAPVAVLDSDCTSLLGEISPLTLTLSCGEATAAAVVTLSAGDLMAYIDAGGPTEDLLRIVESRLKDKNIKGFFENFVVSDTNLSEEDDETLLSLMTLLEKLRHARSSSYSGRMVRRTEAIVCHRESSLAAVMIQALAHRVNYVWVIEEEDCGLVGVVTFSGMLEVFHEHFQAMTEMI